MIYGAILAGGIGKRIKKYSFPKQFINIGGMPIIVHTIKKMLSIDCFDFLYVAVNKDWVVYTKMLFDKYLLPSDKDRVAVIEGGKERIYSFSNIVSKIKLEKEISDSDVLICHDSVRPFATKDMFINCIKATQEYGFALAVTPVNDTIHTCFDDFFITGSLNRRNLYKGQTPSGFNLKILSKVLDESTEEEKNSSTGTTQLVLNKGYKIRIVNGDSTNFKITTDNDVDLAQRIFESTFKKNEIQLLDCTLRDGGIVIGFDFGEQALLIKKSLEDSGVDFIECGYINDKKGSHCGRTCFLSEKDIEKWFLSSGKKSGIKYVAMIDYGTYDVNRLETRRESGIDGIRFAFHKENWKEAIEKCKTILSKGYELYIQPMVTLRYSADEFKELIEKCNEELPNASGFYIVDSFGQMDSQMLVERIDIADTYANEKFVIGFHAHNNRQLAFSNASTFIGHHFRHRIMLDSSIMGMGKGAGNLCTELIIPVLNALGNCYSSVEIYDSINSYFSIVYNEHKWGYSLDYYLSSLYGCTPSYINIFKADKRVDTNILIDLLKNIPEGKKAACDKVFAENYLRNYFNE